MVWLLLFSRSFLEADDSTRYKSAEEHAQQQALSGEIAEIKRLYPDDKAKQSELQMELL
jgi:membrane protein insertase Oxa1/YidC/SpoIIIJ